jgi:ribosomal protein L34E
LIHNSYAQFIESRCTGLVSPTEPAKALTIEGLSVIPEENLCFNSTLTTRPFFSLAPTGVQRFFLTQNRPWVTYGGCICAHPVARSFIIQAYKESHPLLGKNQYFM